ncbi:hypothetical protein GCM10009744_07010 [Kribbella alba]|uniref:Uncharacterized protein n=1 Tax=Kribbella alba TaxID=190197 RepID=A0ABN2EYI9_9ACTN
MRQADCDITRTEQCGAGQRIVNVTPAVRPPPDPVQPQPQVFRDRGGPAHGVQVDSPRVGDRADSFAEGPQVQLGNGVLERAGVCPEERAEYLAEAVVRADLGAGPPLPAGAAPPAPGSRSTSYVASE